MTRHSHYDTSLAAAETIARRMPIIWWGMVSPTSASHAEMVKMVVEKQMAMAEACFAFHTEMFKAALSPWWNMSAEAHAKAADGMMQAVMAPSSRRAKANALRLRRR
ncbi:hypothetical protein [Aestuariivirga sp.]|uniref:hypothetical protein n=1 Tax=Aestuariivirga sp. TaxID=2650926 RepID=UPI00359492D5